MNITFMYKFNNEVYHYIDSDLMLKVKYKSVENIDDTSFPFFFVKVSSETYWQTIFLQFSRRNKKCTIL